MTNGDLSQTESNTIASPLRNLAEVCQLDYADLLTGAGHRAQHNDETAQRGIVAGFPCMPSKS